MAEKTIEQRCREVFEHKSRQVNSAEECEREAARLEADADTAEQPGFALGGYPRERAEWAAAWRATAREWRTLAKAFAEQTIEQRCRAMFEMKSRQVGSAEECEREAHRLETSAEEFEALDFDDNGIGAFAPGERAEWAAAWRSIAREWRTLAKAFGCVAALLIGAGDVAAQGIELGPTAADRSTLGAAPEPVLLWLSLPPGVEVAAAAPTLGNREADERAARIDAADEKACSVPNTLRLCELRAELQRLRLRQERERASD